ncbi:MAG: diadenylate cyclase [Candidatus Vogelbacteria bacterium]|nr:diadenylate cyclase [Candidatus Vogelbacteria bacterium]
MLSIKDTFDLLFVAGAIYFVIFFIKQSRSYVLAYAVSFFVAFVILTQVFQLSLSQQLLRTLGPLILFIFVVVFQRELRQFFDWIFISTRRLTHSRRQSLLSDSVSFAVMKSVQEMATKKIGALIVLPGELPLEGIIQGGFSLDGRVSVPLLLSIFDVTSPGHDGAMIIDNNRVRKFGAHLPLAENYQTSPRTGTRHRAAAGLTEKSDALVIVVSEERGEISVAEHGKLEKVAEPHVLEERINKFVSEAQEPEFSHFWHVFLVRNWKLKVVSLFLAIVLKVII